MDLDHLIDDCEKSCQHIFREIDLIALLNQEKILQAFQRHRIALRHFSATTGYGYNDEGREKLCMLFADVFHGESALVSPQFASGTHAISTVLFGLLRPGESMLSLGGDPYDTLLPVIQKKGIGSLADFDIGYHMVPLLFDRLDHNEIIKAIQKHQPNLIFLQRSGGYNFRPAHSFDDMKTVISLVNQHTKAPVIVDNCYGEFVENQEPLAAGADIIVGSLIKNPGGGLAPTGGYIVGNRELIQKIEGRFTAPGIGNEVGSYSYGYQYFYQGLFMAPHTVAQAMKASALFGTVFKKLGYDTLPDSTRKGNDIIRSIRFASKEQLIAFCQAIQKCSPIDSFAVPVPWDMPGYQHQVIMAAGTFVQGASIELSADSPIVEPYTAYLQGSLTFEHAKIALKHCLAAICAI